MKNNRIYKKIRCFCALLTVCCALCLGAVLAAQVRYPDSLYLTTGTPLRWKGTPAVSLKSDGAVSASSAGAIFGAQLSLGVFPVKTVSIKVVDPKNVIACGTPFGIRMRVDGVFICQTSSPDGKQNPGELAGLAEGDVITVANGETGLTARRLADIFSESNGESVSLVFRRDGQEHETELRAIYSPSDGRFRSGLWVRDSAAGLGTLTLCRPSDGGYAGLGHAVCDAQTGMLLPLGSGEVCSVSISNIVPGRAGSPGELVGNLLPDTLGSLDVNAPTGLYGTLFVIPEGEVVEVATRSEVETGKAYIICTLDGNGPKRYEIEIERLHPSDESGRNMVIKVTDSELLRLTGGIVQGMSGSPIIQNGKLIGAVTHVFVNYPNKGYALFADTMLDGVEHQKAA